MSVATLGVIRSSDRSVPFTNALGEDPEVVAMKMHWMNDVEIVVDNNSDGAILSKIIDIPLGIIRVGCVTKLREK